MIDNFEILILQIQAFENTIKKNLPMSHSLDFLIQRMRLKWNNHNVRSGFQLELVLRRVLFKLCKYHGNFSGITSSLLLGNLTTKLLEIVFYLMMFYQKSLRNGLYETLEIEDSFFTTFHEELINVCNTSDTLYISVLFFNFYKYIVRKDEKFLLKNKIFHILRKLSLRLSYQLQIQAKGNFQCITSRSFSIRERSCINLIGELNLNKVFCNFPTEIIKFLDLKEKYSNQSNLSFGESLEYTKDELYQKYILTKVSTFLNLSLPGQAFARVRLNLLISKFSDFSSTKQKSHDISENFLVSFWNRMSIASNRLYNSVVRRHVFTQSLLLIDFFRIYLISKNRSNLPQNVPSIFIWQNDKKKDLRKIILNQLKKMDHSYELMINQIHLDELKWTNLKCIETIRMSLKPSATLCMIAIIKSLIFNSYESKLSTKTSRLKNHAGRKNILFEPIPRSIINDKTKKNCIFIHEHDKRFGNILNHWGALRVFSRLELNAIKYEEEYSSNHFATTKLFDRIEVIKRKKIRNKSDYISFEKKFNG